MAFSTTPSEGADRLRATSEGQTINALGGNDWIRSTFSGSTLYGGLGHDRITVFLELLEPTQLDSLLTTSLFGGNGNDWLETRFALAEEVELANFAIQQSGGRGNDNLFVGIAFEDDAWSQAGDYDIALSGGTGDDSIWTEIEALDAAADISVDAGFGSDVVYIYSLAGNFEPDDPGAVQVYAGDGDDDVTVYSQSGSLDGSTNNILLGGAGNDRLEAYAGGGSNTLDGGEGDDILIADSSDGSDSGAGASNAVTGGEGDDTIQLASNVSGPFVFARIEAYGDAGDDTIESVVTLGEEVIEDSDSFGTTLLYGGTGNDTLTATTRDDAPDFDIGTATLYGGDGNDILRVNGGVENVLNGGAGNDTITGGSGNDRIIGGSGADILRSGGGEDAFVYLWTTGIDLATRDTIRGFGFGDDVIDLSAIDANANQRGNQAFTFGGGTGVGRAWVEDNATGTGSVIRANTGGAEQLYINVEDGTGRDAADWTADDFIL